jgi:hypothetical protein
MFVAVTEDLRERLEAAEHLLFSGHGALEAGHGAAPDTYNPPISGRSVLR